MFALILDVDGVIADTEPLSRRASTQAFNDLHSVTLKDSDHLPFMGTTATKHAEGIAAAYGLSIDTEEVVSAHREHFIRELETSEDLVFPGVHAIVAAIEAVLKEGPRTPDLGGSANTTQVGEAIAALVAAA